VVESVETQSKSISPLAFDLYWQSDRGNGREVLLEKLVQTAQERGWRGDFHCDWAPWDLLLVGDNWHAIELRTATEELGEGNRFTRVRARLRVTGVATASAVTTTLWSGLAIWQDVHWAQWIAIIGCTFLAARLLRSRHACRRAVAGLLASSARRGGLTPVRMPTAPKADPVDAAADSADLHAAQLRA
jgi:hypothetical protein